MSPAKGPAYTLDISWVCNKSHVVSSDWRPTHCRTCGSQDLSLMVERNEEALAGRMRQLLKANHPAFGRPTSERREVTA